MKSRAWVAAAAFAVSVGVGAAAGCGSEDEGSSAGPASGEKSEIAIGAIGSYSSPQGGTIVGGRDVLNAWAKMVNEAGGVDGHPVKLVVKDDAGDPAKALSLVKELVTRDKVVAIVGHSSFLDTVWAPYIGTQGVPVLGGSPYATPFLTDPNFFSIGTNNAAQNYALLAEAKKLGTRFANLYCAEAPVCAVGNSYLEAFAPELGVDMKVAQKVSASQPNYTAVCKAIKDSGAASFSVAHSSAIAIKISEDCVDLGVKGENVATGGTADAAWLDRPKLDGTLNVELAAPYFDDSTAGTKRYRDFVSKYLPDFGKKDGAGPQYAYIATQLLEAAVKAAPADEVTSETIKKGLYSLKDETLDGLTAPLNYVEGKPSLNNCWFVSQIKDGEWTAPNGARYQCAPDEVIATGVAKVAKK